MNKEIDISSRSTGEYISRINRVIDFIDKNVDKDITLDALAQIANFSKYHFHRLFSSFLGETIFHYIQRLRLEKSAARLLHEPGTTITEIAYACGFSSSAAFAKNFKKYFGMSASEWRKEKRLKPGKDSRAYNNPGKPPCGIKKEIPSSAINVEYRNSSQLWIISTDNKKHTVEVKIIPETTVAYIRYIGPYKGDAALFERLFNKLFKWAGPRDLVRFPETRLLVVYHDDPDITAVNKLRVSACITVPADTKQEGEIGRMTIPTGKYAITLFELSASEYQQAWDWVYGSWLPLSGYVPDDRPCFELYHFNGNDRRSKDKNTVEICVPVKPL